MIVPLARRALHWSTAALAHTWRLEVIGERKLTRARCGSAPVIYAVWHGQFLPALWHRRRRGITLLVSSHADGRAVAGAAARWGYGIIFGSSTRGGAVALRAIVRVLGAGAEAALAPDGPRGPRQAAKPGVVAAAQLSGAAIIPVAAHASRAWQARSWDRMLVPRPFARVRIVYGDPFHVGPGARARRLATRHLELELGRAEALAQCGR